MNTTSSDRPNNRGGISLGGRPVCDHAPRDIQAGMVITSAGLAEILEQNRPLCAGGATASYIPELSRVDPGLLGVCVAGSGGEVAEAGDSRARFTIQSVSKILSFTCCLLDSSMEEVRRRVSFEPTADGFNSIVNLETKNYNRPLNPMLNSGAIATLTLIRGGNPQERFQRVLDFARTVSGNPEVGINEAVYLSEKETGSRNRALAWYMKSTGVIDGDIEELLDAYFRCCAIEMDCVDLSRTALRFARDGDGLFPRDIARTVKAVMTLCGMYDESGDVAVEIGLPSKSGVGGGILSLVPGRLGIGVYGPALNEKGSSVAGLAVLREISRRWDLCIF